MEKSQSYFDLFVIPASFDVDLAELTQRYLKLQKAVHPDKYVNASEQERLFSVQQTARLNDAYNTLKKPLLRARYILEINGVDLNDEHNSIMDTVFLMQQLELREALEKANTKTSDVDALDHIIDKIDEMYTVKLQDIKKEFAAPDPAFNKIAELVRKLQFFSKLREEADVIALQKSNN